MTRAAQRHHETPSAARLAGAWIGEQRPGAEIDLGGLAGPEVEPHRSLGRPAAHQRRHHPVHRGVAAAVTVLATQHGVDHHARNPVGEPALDHGAIRLHRGNRRAGASCPADRRGERGIVGQHGGRIEPALGQGERAERRDLRPAHQAAAGNVPVTVPLAQPRQHLSIMMHLESPATHRSLPGPKRSEGSGGRVFEMPALSLAVAPLCRKLPGS